MPKLCPICGKRTTLDGLCAACRKKAGKLFPGGEWQAMHPDEIRAALEEAANPQPAYALSLAEEPGKKAPPKPKRAPRRSRKKKSSPLNTILWGLLLLAFTVLTAPLMMKDYWEYFRAKERRYVEAILEDYTWSWNSSKEQYEIRAWYRWELDGSSGICSSTQTRNRPRHSHVSRPVFSEQGKRSDPAEVRPGGSITLRAYKKADGSWKVARNSSADDMTTIILGYILLLILSVWVLAAGIKDLISLIRHPEKT
ncbi:MAG: hypothetical protein IKX79_04930 [Desulfovibrionaceae bacterium]|nr:hypothetical protein [Desulfovibrionaceae bacterium]